MTAQSRLQIEARVALRRLALCGAGARRDAGGGRRDTHALCTVFWVQPRATARRIMWRLHGQRQERYAGPELGTIRLLRVVGKRAKERFVPLVPAVLDLMGDYLESRGLPRGSLPCPAATPLIPALPSNAEIGRIRHAANASKIDPAPEHAASARQTGPFHPVQLYKAIKQFFAPATTASLREESPHARAFSAAPPQWLRKTLVSHAPANGMSLESARNFAGRDSLDTTSIYATAELGRQYCEAEEFLPNCATR